MADIYIFGDSITWGAFDERGGWADRLKQYFLQQKVDNPSSPSTEVYNLAIDGDNSLDVAKRIKFELQARRKPWSMNEDLVLVSIGTNDVYAEGSPENFRVSTADYRANLEKIYDDVMLLDLRLAFVSLIAVDESRTNPASWGQYYWSNARIKEFNQVLFAFCKEKDIFCIDLFDEMVSSDYQPKLFDGAHPKTEGHQWMYEQIKPKILEMM